MLDLRFSSFHSKIHQDFNNWSHWPFVANQGSPLRFENNTQSFVNIKMPEAIGYCQKEKKKGSYIQPNNYNNKTKTINNNNNNNTQKHSS